MRRNTEDPGEDLRPAPLPAKLVLVATPFLLLGAFLFLHHWLGSP